MIRVFISYAMCRVIELKPMDIKTAYSKMDIEEKIFLQQPEGFKKFDNQGNTLIKLKKL